MDAWAQDPPDAEGSDNNTITQQEDTQAQDQTEPPEPSSEQDNGMEAQEEATAVPEGQDEEEEQPEQPELEEQPQPQGEQPMQEEPEQPAPEEQSQPQDEQQMQEEPSSADSAIMAMQVSDLEGMTVVNQDGEKIGEVGKISQHNQSGDLYAIVGVGGFLGIGQSGVALAIDEMEVQDDQLVLKTNRTEEEVKQASDDYNEDDYTQVDSDMTLSEASS